MPKDPLREMKGYIEYLREQGMSFAEIKEELTENMGENRRLYSQALRALFEIQKDTD